MALILALSSLSGTAFADSKPKQIGKFDCSTVAYLADEIMLTRLDGKPQSVWVQTFENSKTNPKNPDENKVQFGEFGKTIVRDAYATTFPPKVDQQTFLNIIAKYKQNQISKCERHNAGR